MGPNPLKLCEELLDMASVPTGSVVLDLGSGAGLTSALMARECGYVVYAADLWSDPSDNMRFFEKCGLTNRQIVPLKADATALPFAHGFFDAVVSVFILARQPYAGVTCFALLAAKAVLLWRRDR